MYSNLKRINMVVKRSDNALYRDIHIGALIVMALYHLTTALTKTVKLLLDVYITKEIKKNAMKNRAYPGNFIYRKKDK